MTNSQLSPKMFKKDKSRIKELNVNKSLINLYDNKMRVQSPKLNKPFFEKNNARKGSLNVPTSAQNKDKLRRNVFKVKDP